MEPDGAARSRLVAVARAYNEGTLGATSPFFPAPPRPDVVLATGDLVKVVLPNASVVTATIVGQYKISFDTGGFLGALLHLDEEGIGVGLGDEADDRLVGGVGGGDAQGEPERGKEYDWLTHYFSSHWADIEAALSTARYPVALQFHYEASLIAACQ